MFTITALFLAATHAATPLDAAPSVSEVRASIQRSIPYIEEKGVWWMTEKKCVTCHRTGNMVWTLGAARQRGFAVNERLDEWFNWSVEKSFVRNDKGQMDGTLNKEGVAQLLLAGDFFPDVANRPETYQQLASLVVDGQQPDGTWKPGGQLPGQKRPAAETTDVTTMWLALALAGQGANRELDLAMQRIAVSPPGKSTEWYLVRLLLAERTGDKAQSASLIEALRSQQQADGGWGWIVGEQSDALGTGMSLYALLRAGVDRDDTAINRGLRFLISTQRDDGSWAVRGTKANKKDRIEETAIYWGTTWAALGLVESLATGDAAE